MAETTAESVMAAFPKGVILPWNSKYPKDNPSTRVPKGWAICDGQNDTPDLRKRFLMGTDSFADVGASGGAAAHEARRVAKENNAGEGYYCVKAAGRSRQTEILPPFASVIFIMKL